MIDNKVSKEVCLRYRLTNGDTFGTSRKTTLTQFEYLNRSLFIVEMLQLS